MDTLDPGDEPHRSLEAARRRLREAVSGSPEEDAAWNAAQALEATLQERPGRGEPSPAGDQALRR